MKRIVQLLILASMFTLGCGSVFGFSIADEFTGEVTSAKTSKTWKATLRIVKYDQRSGAFNGELSWPSLKSVHRVIGTVSGRTVVFKETERIKKGSAHLHCEYALINNDSGQLEGRWIEPGHDRGVAVFK